MKTKRNKFIALGIYGLINLTLLFQITNLQTLPSIYIIILFVLSIMMMGLLFFLQFKSKKQIVERLGIFLLVFIASTMIVGSFFVYKAESFLYRFSGESSKNDAISIIVKKNSYFTEIFDVKDLVFGKEDANEDIVLETFDFLEKQLEQKIASIEFKNYLKLAQALLNDEIEVIVLNEAFRNIVEESIDGFSEITKIIYQYNKETKLQTIEKKASNKPFMIMISGIDVYGTINNSARSDVNILAAVNPKRKEVLLISIPRDYYLPLGCEKGELDKLTHAGMYGIDCTMKTVGNAFDVNIDYFVRVNFSSLINVVDAVGGIVVNADYPFSYGGTSFVAGENYLDGKRTLVFVRDRYSQEGGDLGRGKNQMKVVSALINKMTSPAIITNFNSILKSLEGSIQTNMQPKEITDLIKIQLKDMSKWQISETQVDGYDGSEFAHAIGHFAYVMHPNQASVEAAKIALNSIMKK